jgi:uncharacterized metal-binding protein
LVWEAAQSQLDGTASLLRAVNNMLFMPQEVVFVILRGLIIVAMLYVIADFFMASAKRNARRRRPITQSLKSTFHESNDFTSRS